MGTRDESVPYEHVRRVWRSWEGSGRLVEGSHFVEIAGGDHGLVESAETIAREIVALAGDTASRS
jgi:pimeloyl-ACP methyl ester carboxylesterase